VTAVPATILIVDDEESIRRSVADVLQDEGYRTASAPDGDAALRAVDGAAPDLVLLDVAMPGRDGIEVLERVRRAHPGLPVVMMSGHATIDTAVQATRLGAFDFLEKPVALERLRVVLRNAQAARGLAAENRRLREGWAQPIVGRSAAVRKLLDEIRLAGPSPARVLIQGENGTGKELVARALHAASPRRERPFVPVNCSAIPDELVESELFGHEKGAFTGATQSRRGRFEEADGGTLFLDEVADLSPRAQTKLLRVLEAGELTRVGGSRPIAIDVRVVAATNRDLAAAIASEVFREDLYFRLAVIPITVPPLRDRSEDVPLLVEHFAARLAKEMGRRSQTFAPEALERLRRYAFPGNVRELRNVVERLIIMNPGVPIDAERVAAVLPRTESAAAEPRRLSEVVRDFERRQIEAALAAEGGSMTRAAARLGLERSHLYKKMKQLGWKAEA
jgi:two-component system nitrogen regulation response regulator NtrX